ncbi:MAG: hypothetical protein FJ106_04240 [Deltaproteobacteria bacterium]|nr:hypothetical protein [Deltaproteobacteria bacterium]
MSLRVAAIAIEVIILTAMIYSFFLGLRLTLSDLGLQPKYEGFLKLVLTTLGIFILTFFIAHLILFYPGIIP